MIWDIEERIEDAVAAYLRGIVPGSTRVYAAWGFTEAQFPCVIVFSRETKPLSDTANYHDPVRVSVEVVVATEAAPLQEGGVELATARERNKDARSPVVAALATADLCSNLRNTGVANVVWSSADIVSRARDFDAESRILRTTITIDVIASPGESA